MTLTLLLLGGALICFAVAAIGFAVGRVNLIAAGLALLTVSFMLGTGVLHA